VSRILVAIHSETINLRFFVASRVTAICLSCCYHCVLRQLRKVRLHKCCYTKVTHWYIGERKCLIIMRKKLTLLLSGSRSSHYKCPPQNKHLQDPIVLDLVMQVRATATSWCEAQPLRSLCPYKSLQMQIYDKLPFHG